MKRVDQACCTNDCRAMLIIMKNRNTHFFTANFLHNKTIRSFYIFKINSTKCWL